MKYLKHEINEKISFFILLYMYIQDLLRSNLSFFLIS